MHNDIKSENILVDTKSLKMKLIDFGSATLLTDNVVAGITHKPPEYIKYRKYDVLPATVWTLGILLFEMVCGDIPFKTDSQSCSGELDFVHPITVECQDLIQHCLKVDLGSRIDLFNILHHPYCS